MTVAKIWDGAQWVTIQGPPGPQGLQGIQGPIGPSGVAVQAAAPDPASYQVWVDTDEPDPDAAEAVRLVGAAGEPALGSGWSLYGVGWQAIGFYKTPSGVVYVQGMLKKSTAVVSGEVLWTLPVGYRPLGNCLFAVMSNSAIGRVDIQPDGDIAVLTGNAAWVSLAGISFRAEQ